MQHLDTLPTQQAMKRPHRIRKFRRGNDEHGGRAYLGRRTKAWKNPHYTLRSVA